MSRAGALAALLSLGLAPAARADLPPPPGEPPHGNLRPDQPQPPPLIQPTEAPPTDGPDAGATPETAARDVAAVFADKCAGCHGLDGHGATKYGRKHHIPSFATRKWQAKLTDTRISSTIADGVFERGEKRMPPFKDKLSADQIAALTAYVRRFGR